MYKSILTMNFITNFTVMKIMRVIFSSLLILTLMSCEQDNIVLPSENINDLDISMRVGNGGCTAMSFCLQLQGMITSDLTSVENCVNEKTTQLIVSTSSGPNNPMIANISLLQPDGCFEIITGLMAITQERRSGLGRLEFYFQGSNGKNYSFVSRGVISGDDWLPTQSGEVANVDFTNMEWEIKTEGGGKGKKGKDECVTSGVFPQTPRTIAIVSNGSCVQ